MLAVYTEDDGNGNIYHPSVSDANGSDPRIIERTEFTKRSLTDIEERSDIGSNNCVYIRVRFNTRQDLETLHSNVLRYRDFGSVSRFKAKV